MMGLGQRQGRMRPMNGGGNNHNGNQYPNNQTTTKRGVNQRRISTYLILPLVGLCLLAFQLSFKPSDYYSSVISLDDHTSEIGSNKKNFDIDNGSNNKKVATGATGASQEGAASGSKTSEKKTKNKKKQLPDTKNKNSNGDNEKEWKWFDGDLNAYYNSLEEQIHDRDPAKIASYAVHRWMTPKRSTEEHYELIDRAVSKHITPLQHRKLKVFDGGCGLGSALMFFHDRHPDWELTGHTISEDQHKFIQEKLPKHSFQANLRSYDDIDDGIFYDVIYSIEALIHSTDVEKTMKEWVAHLEPGGIIVIIDDYVSEGVNKSADDIQAFSKSWLANVLITPTEFEDLGRNLGVKTVENRDLLTEYEIVKVNYRNHKPVIKPVADRNHQGWMGSKWRQRLTVEGKLSYNMIVLKKS